MSNACTTLQRMTEVHDYKYQQLHGQLGHVQRDVGLEMAFYLKGKAVCHLYLVTVFADFFCYCSWWGSSVSSELVEVNAMAPHYLSAFGNFHPDVSAAQ